MARRILLINIAGLGCSTIGEHTPHLRGLAEHGSGVVAVQPPVPALTGPSQATMLTGALPSQHGIVANGWYFPELALILNWQRSARLMQGETLWEAGRARWPGFRCANLFWRYATHSTCDVNVVERPTYWADGRKSEDIYAEPDTVHDELVEALGPFPLFRFWGPAADIASTRWIVDATLHLMQPARFDLLLTYLPHLDYDHQRYGPESPQGVRALRDLDAEAGRLIARAHEMDMDIAVVSDYAFEPVSRPVFINRMLREAGWLRVQQAENGELLEPGASRAFAVCDQQVAHVYVDDLSLLEQVRKRIGELDGVDRVLDAAGLHAAGLSHPRSGQLLALAEPDCWFAYPYWLDDARAPDFATCVAIHAKPGWDPSELFWRPGWRGKLHIAKRLLQKKLGLRAPFDLVGGDPHLVCGSHGRIPSDDRQRATMITSWPLSQDRVAMQEIKGLLVTRMS